MKTFQLTKLHNLVRRLGRWLEPRRLGLPSLFDVAAISFIVILPVVRIGEINSQMIRGLFLVYGTVVLLCVGLASRERRPYRSVLLALIVLWSMRNLFQFNFLDVLKGDMADPAVRVLAIGKVSSGWVNWALMNEGFMYVLFGAVLITVMVKYAKSYRWYYLALVFALAKKYDYIFESWRGWSMTPLLAVCLAATITCLRIRRLRWLGAVAATTGLAAVAYKWVWLWNIKWVSRPDFWVATLGRVKLFGRGFYQTVNTWQGFVAPEHAEFAYVLKRWGLGWRQNDLLEYAETAGLVGALLIVAFFARLLIKGKVGFAWFLVLAAVLKCLFQRTMFFAVDAGLILIMVGLLELETVRRNT